jgi:hypothetical protein
MSITDSAVPVSYPGTTIDDVSYLVFVTPEGHLIGIPAGDIQIYNFYDGKDVCVLTIDSSKEFPTYPYTFVDGIVKPFKNSTDAVKIA